jgi:hypothetical protein
LEFAGSLGASLLLVGHRDIALGVELLSMSAFVNNRVSKRIQSQSTLDRMLMSCRSECL